MSDVKHLGLPVHGYQAQSADKVAVVNVNKELEELVLRQLDKMKRTPEFDQRMIAKAFTDVQQAFMWANRAVFQPARIALPGDNETEE